MAWKRNIGITRGEISTWIVALYFFQLNVARVGTPLFCHRSGRVPAVRALGWQVTFVRRWGKR